MKRIKNPHPNGHRISQLLQGLIDGLTGPTLTFGELREQFSSRLYGFFLLVLALPNLVPVPAPGLSALTGVPLMLLTFQLILGLHAPWFPKWLDRKTIKTQSIRRVFERAIVYVKKLERYVLPRWMFLVHSPMDRVIALACFFLAIAIAMPIPFGNALPALAICFFAVALLQRDGVFVILGLVTGLLAVSIVAASIGAAAEGVRELLS